MVLIKFNLVLYFFIIKIILLFIFFFLVKKKETNEIFMVRQFKKNYLLKTSKAIVYKKKKLYCYLHFKNSNAWLLKEKFNRN